MKIIFRISLFLLLSACKKEIDVVPINCDRIFMGIDTCNIAITHHDVIFQGGYYSPHLFNIDLDNDGTPDIQFNSESWGSPGMGTIPRSSISTLHGDCSILGTFSNDTIYKNIYYDYIPDDTITNINVYTTYSCVQIIEGDSIHSIIQDHFEASALSLNYEMGTSGNFSSGNIFLIDASWGYNMPFYLSGLGTDSVYYSITHNNGDCNNFPQNQIKYIGVKLNKNGIEKLGWIKLSIASKNIITVFESALQQ